MHWMSMCTVWLSHSKYWAQWICIIFCINLEHFSMETIWMIQKATALGTWWLAASLWQCACSCITFMQSFLVQRQIIQVTQLPYSPDLVPCDFWLFQKLKSPLKGKRFQTINEIQENTTGSQWQLGELCEVPRCLLWRGLRCHCPMYKVSCVLNLHQ